jgi:hypothetical protein
MALELLPDGRRDGRLVAGEARESRTQRALAGRTQFAADRGRRRPDRAHAGEA